MPQTPPRLRWGIHGAGRIASSFAADLIADGGTVAAVGARSGQAAEAFADRFGIGHAHTGYEALVHDDEVDIVYVATPQGLHEEHALLALAAGRPVLIEKSFSIDGDSAQRVVDAAHAAGVFAMEAMWTRFLPTAVALRRMLADGALGEVLSVTTAHHQAIRPTAGSRHLDRALGGGALLDLGVYGISFAIEVLGEARQIQALGRPAAGSESLDGDATVLMRHERGRSTTLFSMEHAGPNGASVIGSQGYVELDPFWFTWTGLSRYDGGRPAVLQERIPPGPAPRALHFQAAEVERCIAAGLQESPIMPLAESVLIMRTLDRIRDAIDLTGGETSG